MERTQAGKNSFSSQDISHESVSTFWLTLILLMRMLEQKQNKHSISVVKNRLSLNTSFVISKLFEIPRD